VPQRVRRVVRDACGLAGAEHRLVGGRLGHALEDAPFRPSVLEGAGVLERLDQLLGRVDPAGLVALHCGAGQPQPQPGTVDVTPAQRDRLAEP
jgi:hypothetical protein